MKLTLLTLACALSCAAQSFVTNQPACPTMPSPTIQCGGWSSPAPTTGFAGLIARFFRKGQTTSGTMTLGSPALATDAVGHPGNPLIPPMTVGTVYLRWPVTNNQMIWTIPTTQWTQTVDAQGNSILTVTGIPAHAGFVIEALSR